MLSWTIQITVISIILIFLIHHLINFFKSTLTVPKIKDLVNTPTQKYENMYNIINKQNNVGTKNAIEKKNNQNNNDEYTLIDLLPNTEKKYDETTMKSELKNFLKSQLHENESNPGYNINFYENSNLSSYSNY
jgi:cell shape-determining protein MreC